MTDINAEEFNIEEEKVEPVTFSYNLNCRFCGTKTGSCEIPIERIAGKVANNEAIGIVDVRCDFCKEEHGIYQEMEARFIKETGLSHIEARSFIESASGKQSEFDQLLESKKAELTEKAESAQPAIQLAEVDPRSLDQ